MPLQLSEPSETAEQHFAKIKLCFSESIEPNFRNALNHKAPVAAMMVALAAIDFLASYYCGKEAGPSGYKKFVERYISPLVPKGSKGYNAEVLYRNLRSGLVHSYTTAKTPTQHFQKSDIIYVLIDDPEVQDKHLELVQSDRNKVLFHIQAFFEHIIQAKDQYFNDVEDDDALKTCFSKWYKESSHLCEIEISRLK